MIAANITVHLHDEAEPMIEIAQPNKPGSPYSVHFTSGPGYGYCTVFLSCAQVKQLQAACKEALSHFQMEIPA